MLTTITRALIIDDLRNLNDGVIPSTAAIDIARNSAEAISLLKVNPNYDVIFWDHDLGGEDNTKIVANYITERAFIHEDFPLIELNVIHTDNPSGRQWLNQAFNSRYFPGKKILNVKANDYFWVLKDPTDELSQIT